MPELSEPVGVDATKQLEELLTQGPARIIPRGKDIYDRLVADVVADVFVDGLNIAEMLAEECYEKLRSRST